MRKIDVLKIGIQMIKQVEQLHKLGYLHLDIKLDNILLGQNDSYYIQSAHFINEDMEEAKRRKNERKNKKGYNQRPKKSKLYLIDFGSCAKYLDQKGKHLPNKPVNNENNRNMVFASKNYFDK